ncbi:MAG TPA: acyl-CoA dehydrogenase family protein [Vicinamibacteria bacterium]|nr:acyl-CoA dehydrogenase family protein [Vicinamibacteria bacterium]
MYSFEPSEDQKTLVEAVRRYAGRELRPAMRPADEARALPPQVTRAGWELGLVQGSLPEEFGGFGERSALTGVLAAEELAWGDLAGALALLAPGLVAVPVLLRGSDQQRRELLPVFAQDDYRPAAAALMEPRFDFQPSALKTTARRRGGDYVLSGRKCNVPFAAEAEWTLVYADLEGRTQAFLVRQGTAGLAVRERERNMGLHALPLYEVDLSECVVPAGQRLGGEEGGDLGPVFDASRVAWAALAVGLARAAYEYALDYARTRQAFGEAIAQRQSIAFMLAEMATEVEAARLLAWEAAWRLDQGQDAAQAAYLARNLADDMALMVADRAVQVLGGHGYIRDYPVELWLRNARGFAVLDGLAIV